MSYINVLEQIAEKYNMEQFDEDWIRIIVEDYTELAKDYEKLEIKYNNLINKILNMKGVKK